MVFPAYFNDLSGTFCSYFTLISPLFRSYPALLRVNNRTSFPYNVHYQPESEIRMRH